MYAIVFKDIISLSYLIVVRNDGCQQIAEAIKCTYYIKGAWGVGGILFKEF